MLNFQKNIVDSAISQSSGAWILSPGLGLYTIIENLVLKLEERNKSNKLYIILNIDSTPYYEHFLITPPHKCKVINSNYTSDQRKSIWLSGGVVYVTPRVLIVDLLRKVLPCQLIGGIIVPLPYYYNISASTVESFICNIYDRHLNSKHEGYTNTSFSRDIISASQLKDDVEEKPSTKPTFEGFIKVFSDNPRQFHGSYSKLQDNLECFRVKKLFLWPRFRDEVIKSLVKSPDVVELMVKMPEYQKQLHDAIHWVIKMCIEEINRLNNGNIDISNITVENAMFRSFYVILKSKIDPVFHKLSRKFKQLIHDLDTLRRLLNSLMQLDAVSFYNRIQDIKRNISEDSVFFLLKEAHKIFELAQARIYQIRPLEDNPNDSKIVLTLEDNPKIHIVDEILKEINEDIGDSAENVLVIVKDTKTCDMITKFLCYEDKDHFTLNVFKQYLVRKHLNENPNKKSNRQSSDESKVDLNSPSSLISVVLEFEHKNRRGLAEKVSKTIQYDEYYGVIPNDTLLKKGSNLNVITHTFKDLSRALYDFKPKYIILYDPNLTTVREIEIFKSSHPGYPVRVYFTLFKDSLEDLKYKNSINHEKSLFETIVKEKASMVFTEESKQELSLKQKMESTTRIIVDVREFRSKLPVILHSHYINVIPQTLLIADYIITPTIAVERKSISDLFQSFASGRLYNQMQQMCRHYETPILLIEFDQSSPFILQTSQEIGDRINQSSISSKLALITKSFPKIRILWSRSPFETAQIFIELKKDNPQPDPDFCESNIYSDFDRNDIFEPIDVLKKLPGVTNEGVSKFISKSQVKQSTDRFEIKETTLSSIATMSKKELASYVGDENADTLFKFLHLDPFDST